MWRCGMWRISAIDMTSVVANDFIFFFNIRAIFFNGRKAEALYRSLVWPTLPSAQQHILQKLMPSTSPANAGMNRAQKLAAWRMIPVQCMRQQNDLASTE